MLSKPFLDVFELPLIFIVKGHSLFVFFRIKHQGRVSKDLHTYSLVHGGVKFGDDEVWEVLVE